jgi:pSer/pThr/pTyr-binding forkhead associated (FHA) protein
MAYLVFSTRQGEEIGRRRLDGPLVIGRSPECDVALNDDQLSRRHCRLMPSANGWVLADLDSRNGTKFMGHRISSHVLRDGQVFQIGLVNVIFRAAEMVTGDEQEPGVVRPRRPASPLDAQPQGGSAAGFRFEPTPVSQRTVDEFPVPIPMAGDLDWLDVTGELEDELQGDLHSDKSEPGTR